MISYQGEGGDRLGDLQCARKLLGHKHQTMTEHYTRHRTGERYRTHQRTQTLSNQTSLVWGQHHELRTGRKETVAKDDNAHQRVAVKTNVGFGPHARGNGGQGRN
jgi:hypothetical protein